MKEILRNKTVWIFLAAILTAYALIADFAVYAGEEGVLLSEQNIVLRLFGQFVDSVDGKGSMFTILAVALACLYIKIDSYAVYRYYKFILAAILLAFLTVFYYSYSIGGSISLTYRTGFQLLKSISFLCGYSFLFYFFIIAFYQYSNNAPENTTDRNDGVRGGVLQTLCGQYNITVGSTFARETTRSLFRGYQITDRAGARIINVHIASPVVYNMAF